MALRSIDLNCDMGEGSGNDEAIMPYITSANVACGMHAGDPSVMAATVRLACEHGVAIGAHPSYPDRPGFGRRAMQLSRDEVVNLVLYQLGTLSAITRAARAELHHVKPHGALYNSASGDRTLADAVTEAVYIFSPSLVLMCLPGSALEASGRKHGLVLALEGFADRAYQPNGLLADRSLPSAVYDDEQKSVSQALQLASGSVTCLDGTMLPLHIDTLCLHSDTPGAGLSARLINSALREAGFALHAVSLAS